MAEHPALRDAVIETACNRWLAAEAHWVDCATAVPALAPLFLADVSMRAGDVERAIASMTICDALVPNSPYVQRLRERALTVQQRRAANPDIINAATLADEDLRKAARTAVECHRWPRAVELWTLFLERSGSNPEAYRRLGTCYQNLGDYGNSVLYFREANIGNADPQLTEAIDRSSRLEQRRFDSFLKHLQRFTQHPAFEAAQTAALAGATRLGEDLHTLSLVTKSPIAGSIAPSAVLPPPQPIAPARQAASAPAPPAEARAGVVLREIDLSAYRPRAALPPPLPPTAAEPAPPRRAMPPPLPVSTLAQPVITTAIPDSALRGARSLPLIRPGLTAPAHPQIPPASPTTAETMSLIERLRAINSNT